jgi:hypothetical protein
MVEHFHRHFKNNLRACCAAANWVDHIPWVILVLRAAAREDNSTTPAQAVCSSPLILPGQFLDSPELPPKIFLEQFSKTQSAAKHHPHGQSAAKHHPHGQVLPLQPLYDSPYTVLRRSLHHFTLRIGDK